MNQIEFLMSEVRELKTDNQRLLTTIAAMNNTIMQLTQQLTILQHLETANCTMLNPMERTEAFAKYQQAIAAEQHKLPNDAIR